MVERSILSRQWLHAISNFGGGEDYEKCVCYQSHYSWLAREVTDSVPFIVWHATPPPSGGFTCAIILVGVGGVNTYTHLTH